MKFTRELLTITPPVKSPKYVVKATEDRFKSFFVHRGF